MTSKEIRDWLHVQRGAGASRPLIMGVLNVTPDSFSDGGQFMDVAGAMAHARQMADQGADIIDIGGESTRPGSAPVPAEQQIRRVAPVIASLRKESAIAISIDTTQAAVAAAALDAGADWVNDISAGLGDGQMLPLVAKRRVPIILMHMQGTPQTMQATPTYRNVVAEVSGFLKQRLDYAQSMGIDPADVLLDPGIGFGKTVEHNLQLLKDLPKLAAIGRPVVIGASRKSFIEKITGESSQSHRPFGTAAVNAWAAANGAAVLRVHDVEPAARIVQMIHAIAQSDKQK